MEDDIDARSSAATTREGAAGLAARVEDDMAARSLAVIVREAAAGLAARVPGTAVQETARQLAATATADGVARPGDRFPARAARRALGRLYEWELATVRHRASDLARSTGRLADALAERLDRIEAAGAARHAALGAEAAALAARLDQLVDGTGNSTGDRPLERTTGRDRP